MVPTESKNESPLRVALSKMHLLIKSSLDKDRIHNKHNARTESLALWHTAHNSVRCFGDVNWGLGGSPPDPQWAGTESSEDSWGAPLSLHVPCDAKGNGPPGNSRDQTELSPQKSWWERGRVRDVSVFFMYNRYLWVVHNKHTHADWQEKTIFVSSDSRNIPFS